MTIRPVWIAFSAVAAVLLAAGGTFYGHPQNRDPGFGQLNTLRSLLTAITAPYFGLFDQPSPMGGDMSRTSNADDEKPAAWPPADYDPSKQKLATFAGAPAAA